MSGIAKVSWSLRVAETLHLSFDHFSPAAEYFHCNALTQNATWAKPLTGVKSPYTTRSTLQLDVERCKAACLKEDTYHCRSFDYDRASGQCSLHEMNR